MNGISERDSNMELLRIIAMLFIVFHHFIVHAICPEVLYPTKDMSPLYVTSSFMEGFVYVGVNCFLLISGYYGIKLRVGKLWSFGLQCAFYFIIGYLFAHIFLGMPMTRVIISKTLFPLSHSIWWFVPQYVMLMLLSPILNQGISHLTKKQYQWALICLTFLQVYLSFFWQGTDYGPNGYEITNFIYIYIVGGYIRMYGGRINKDKQRWLCLAIYVVSAILFGICNILRSYIYIPYGLLFGYNNPIVIIAAIALFLFIGSYSFKSKWINIAGGGVFAAYLVQDQSYIGDPLYEWWTTYCGEMNSTVCVVLLTGVFSVVFLMLAILLERSRMWVVKPVLHLFDGVDKRIFEEK